MQIIFELQTFGLRCQHTWFIIFFVPPLQILNWYRVSRKIMTWSFFSLCEGYFEFYLTYFPLSAVPITMNGNWISNASFFSHLFLCFYVHLRSFYIKALFAFVMRIGRKRSFWTNFFPKTANKFFAENFGILKK